MQEEESPRFAVARRLKEIAAYLRLFGENQFRARAYEAGAEAVFSLGPSFEALVADGRLTETPGIGKTLAATIMELIETGTTPALEQYRTDFPPEMLALAELPGLTLPKLRLLQSELGIAGLDDLVQAAKEGRLRTIKGFGAKTEQKLLETIDRRKAMVKRALLPEAQALTNALLTELRDIASVAQAEAAGGVRRWKESVGTLRLVARVELETREAVAIAVRSRFTAAFNVTFTDDDAPPSDLTWVMRFRLATGWLGELWLAPAPRFGTAWVRATGARSHVDRLASRAIERGFDLATLEASTEAEVYARLGLPEIPPELRENWGEIEEADAGADFRDLVALEDIRGFVHCHTTASDGRNSLEEMVAAAKAHGMAYITITDHSPTAAYARGLGPERLTEQAAAIEALKAEATTSGIDVLAGTESDILPDGTLDFSDDVLGRLDIVIASIHARNGMDSFDMTRRLVAAMSLPVFKIWGHALGRMVLRRDPIACKVEEVLDAAAASRAAIEINGDPHRLDLPPFWIWHARRRGLRFVISVDAHSLRDLEHLEYGVRTARRGGVRRQEVLNTLPADEFRRAVRPA